MKGDVQPEAISGRRGRAGRDPRYDAADDGSATDGLLDSILMGVAGQVGGLLWDDPEGDPATANDEDQGDQDVSDDGTARAN